MALRQESSGEACPRRLRPYVEAAISGSGFQYCVTRDGLGLIEGNAPDFVSAKQEAEAELRFLSSAPLQ